MEVLMVVWLLAMEEVLCFRGSGGGDRIIGTPAVQKQYNSITIHFMKLLS